MLRRRRGAPLPDTQRRKRKSGTHPEAHPDPNSADRSQPRMIPKNGASKLIDARRRSAVGSLKSHCEMSLYCTKVV